MEESIVFLKPGREKSIMRKHPWIFSGAIQGVQGNPAPGESVTVTASDGRTLGSGAYNPSSQIQVRMWSFDSDQPITTENLHTRIKTAVAERKDLQSLHMSNSWRLINAENDLLPGIVADLFGDVVVIQLSSAGAYRWRDEIISALISITGCSCLIEKSDSDVNRLEGLENIVKVQYGDLSVDRVLLEENGLKFKLELMNGQKTGFYLDQRTNREILRNMADGKKVLDCFSFTGGFSVNALAGGARHVTAVDSSAPALKLLEANLRLNDFVSTDYAIVQDNVFEYLRKLRDQNEHFDLIILDPPKLAPTSSQVEKASRAYKDINLLAFKLLAPGGFLFTFSCSGGVGLSLFQKIVADAGLDAGKHFQILRYLHQAEDHPILSTFPEGEYLKGLLCKV